MGPAVNVYQKRIFFRRIKAGRLDQASIKDSAILAFELHQICRAEVELVQSSAVRRTVDGNGVAMPAAQGCFGSRAPVRIKIEKITSSGSHRDPMGARTGGDTTFPGTVPL